jgi:hypothetical protein
MEHNLSVHVRMFNDKVRAMNQMQKKDLTLSAAEARNLHADIFELLTHIAEISGNNVGTAPDMLTISMDGGGFK